MIYADEAAAKAALKMFNDRLPVYRLYEDYYEGRHKLSFATDKFRNAFGNVFRAFADNLCPAVVNSAADRLEITGFTTDSPSNPLPEARDIWQRNRMDRKAGEIHTEALKTGDAYAIVWPDPDRGGACIYPNSASQMVCHYSDDDSETIDWAAKLWALEDERYRLTLYYPDRIVKYVTMSKVHGIPARPGAFVSYLVPGELWPLPNWLGVTPVVHFANDTKFGSKGRSELQHVTPLQDALNKTILDMLVAMEFQALPQRWATGLELDNDPVTGRPKSPFEPGGLWVVGDEQAKFGQFEPADLGRFTNVANDFRMEIARVTGTPQHYLSLGSGAQSAFVASMYPSGESLKTAEAPFVAKIKDRQTLFGDMWEDLMALALQIDGVEIDKASLSTLWISAEPRSEVEDTDVAQKKVNLGIPNEVVWRELGYTESQIADMSTQAQTKADQALALAQAQSQPNGPGTANNPLPPS